ncbi:MAG: NAD-dependent succinate-semialdehyde dehydrogenase [Actinobacteria bacterium]|nr:NAD-dependent succinate-semialdehyde dehydrogenase [Actinomycetota bacterium]
MTTTVNPTTGEPLEEYPDHDADEVAWRLARAWTGYEHWAARPLDERLDLLRSVADSLESRKPELARLMTQEMGKPIAQAEAEVDKCAWVCRHYAEHAPKYLERREIDTDAARSYVRFDPLGPVFAVMPWNFPLWQVFRFAAPSIALGNVGLLKHATNVTGCSLAIEGVFAGAGAPDGVFQALLIDHDQAATVIADERVRGVTLTGSNSAGKVIASRAGEHLKKTVLELGGSDPFIVLDDADLDRAAEVGVNSRLINSGQSCIAAKRFIVHAAVADAFIERFRARLEALSIGDPSDRDTEVGPLAREDLRDDLHDQVQRSQKEGATLVTGGQPLDRAGFFYAPTLLTDVGPHVPAGAEETFGPVAAVITVADDDDAVAIANSTEFGLGASLWTRDLDRAERLAGSIQVGSVFVNELVKSDPRVPFGGVKGSGYGRELGEFGIHEFANIKTVWVEHP